MKKIIEDRINELNVFLADGGLRTDDPSYGNGYDSATQNEIDFLKDLLITLNSYPVNLE